MTRSAIPETIRPPSCWGRALLVAALATGSVSWSSRAIAQPIDKDSDAERLFREAQKLLEERRYGEACPKFEAAYRKDQQLGTLLNLAYCHKEQGAVWQAWVEFKEAEGKAIELKRNDRRDFARQRMAELEKQLGKVQIEAQHRVELVEVLVEDRQVPEAEKGQVFAVELGQRKFTFRATGKKPSVQMITVAKGNVPLRIVVPEMEDAPPPVAEPPPPPVPVKPETPTPAQPQNSRSTQRTAGLALAGAGLLGIGIGSVTGVMTFTNDCKKANDPQCTVSELDQARLTSTVSDISFIAGGILLAGGLLLFFLAPSNKAAVAALPPKHGVHVLPEIGAGWGALRGTF